ncbi:unnamed protein product, partial [Closterium sp. NIES-53]
QLQVIYPDLKVNCSALSIKSEDTGGSHDDDNGAVQAVGEGHAVTAVRCSPGSAGRAARWSLSGSAAPGRLGCSRAARLLLGGSAATGRLGCSRTARWLQGGSAAAAGRLGWTAARRLLLSG